MQEINGQWIMSGIAEDDPYCIHTAEELVAYIHEIGFLPLFQNDIPGFSVEERTVGAYWWGEDPSKDPWAWREVLSEREDLIYGKFFEKKAGFISKEWVPYFANMRRDGYDFDAAWDDGLMSRRQKKIMDCFLDSKEPILSAELKQLAGFGKGGEKNFEGVISDLQMRLYLCMSGFRKRCNKKGQEYGWSVAQYATPEGRLGYDLVAAAYKEEPTESAGVLIAHMKDVYPIATDTQIAKILGIPKKNGKYIKS